MSVGLVRDYPFEVLELLAGRCRCEKIGRVGVDKRAVPLRLFSGRVSDVKLLLSNQVSDLVCIEPFGLALLPEKRGLLHLHYRLENV